MPRGFGSARRSRFPKRIALIHTRIVSNVLRPALLYAWVVAAAWSAEPYRLDLPKGFPAPKIPVANPLSDAKVRLGRYLFYDPRMSVNRTQSCATCHRQELAFTDGRATAIGATGEDHPRGAMSLVNVAYASVLTWSDPDMRSLEKQALVPMLAEHPVELGLRGREEAVLEEFRADPVYSALFPEAFSEKSGGTNAAFTLANVAKALAAFERTIISARSPWDRFHYGNEAGAISASAKRGEVIFFDDGLSGCFRCHGGFNFSDATDYVGSVAAPAEFHNTGLYNLPGALSYPAPNLGVYEHTKRPADVGKFKTPTLRNVELTAPYMHDGSIATLEEVLDHYAAGGRTISTGPFAGRGHDNPHKDARINGVGLTAQNRADLIAFLRSLTDTELTRDPRFSDPWPSNVQ
jgi:cytochrome c peroxidase